MSKNTKLMTWSLAVVLVVTLSIASIPAGALGPFVEPEAVAIHTFEGEQIGDGFGWVAENLGDISGDDVNDVIIPAPFHSINGTLAGKVYVYSGSDGALLNAVTGNDYDQFGWSASTAGDVNSDGVPDYIVGGIGSLEAPIRFKGRAVVYSGADHSVIHEFIGPDGAGFGYGVAGAGDVNGDGYDDVIIGAAFASFTLFRAGRVYVYSGKTGEELWHRDGNADDDFLGSGVGRVGLVDQDGVPDLVAGAFGAGPANGGEAYVYSGSTGRTLLTLRPASHGTALRFGQFFASGAGDVNADGTPDIFVADYPDRRGGGAGSGRAYVFSGADGSRLYLFNAEARGDGLGPGRGIGDVNGDGHADLIIAAYTSDAGAVDGGRAYVRSGKDGSLMRTITGRIANDNLGVDALAVGDVNDDGLVDYLVTAVGNSFAGLDTGRAYIVAGVP